MGTIAAGRAAHTEGWNTKVIENYGHAEGYQSTAGYIAHAEGNQTEALGDKSHSEGALTKAVGKESHAEGYNTKAMEQRAHAEGASTTALGFTSHTEGFQTLTGIKGFYVATKEENGVLSWDIDNSNPKNPTIALENYGDESYGTYAVKDYVAIKVENSFDLNFGRIRAITDNRILLASIPPILLDATPVTHGAVIFVNTKPEIGAVSVGGTYAHAEGNNTKAFGDYSHSEGLGTVAAAESQHASGKYNVGKPDTLYEVGNGTGEYARSNAFEVYEDGHAEVQVQGETDNSVVLKKTLADSIPFVPKTIHFRYGSDYDYPKDDPWEWLNKYPSDSDVYTSEPLLVYVGPTQWNCFIAEHAWIEPDPDDPSTWHETAYWEKLDIVKSTDLPKDKGEFGVIVRDTDNYLATYPATIYEIKSAKQEYKPIVPKTLPYSIGCHGVARLSTMPTADENHLGWIVLYTGETNETYKNDTLYECVDDGGYKWVEMEFAKKTDLPRCATTYGTKTDINNFIEIYAATESVIKDAKHKYQPIVPYYLGYGVGCHGIARFATMPAAESKYLDWIVLYTGATNDTYVNNTMYICVNNDGYKWVKYTLAQIPQKLIASTSYGTMIDDYNYISVYPAAESTIKQGTHAYQPVAVKNFGYAVGCNGIVRLSTIPTAANKYEGWVVLYTGETNETYTKNTMYECVNDGGYKWVEYTPAPIGDIQAALDSIIAIQNSFLGGE